MPLVVLPSPYSKSLYFYFESIPHYAFGCVAFSIFKVNTVMYWILGRSNVNLSLKVTNFMFLMILLEIPHQLETRQNYSI